MGFRWFTPNALIYCLGDMVDLTKTPDNLPIPEDDGAAKHLVGMTLLKRLTLIVKEKKIVNVHYPIFPSDSDPAWVIDYLKANQ